MSEISNALCAWIGRPSDKLRRANRFSLADLVFSGARAMTAPGLLAMRTVPAEMGFATNFVPFEL
jgi:hypothetical protein